MSRLDEIGCYQKDYLQKAAEIDAFELEEDAKEELKEDWLSFYRRLVQRDYEVKNKFNFHVKEKIVKEGKSKILEEWQTLSSITDDDFLEALKWVCDDPANGGPSKNSLTRRIGLSATKVVKLHCSWLEDEAGVVFYKDGFYWGGESFEVDCDNPDFSDKNGKASHIFKIYINARDKI